MRRRLITALDRLLPGLTRRLRALRASGTTADYDSLRTRIVDLEAEIRALKEEIDEARRDSLRIAQLTDLVQERLAK